MRFCIPSIGLISLSLTTAAMIALSWTTIGPSSLAKACVTGPQTAPTSRKTPSAWNTYFKSHSKKSIHASRIPSSTETTWSPQLPWGGKDSKNWKAEAILANAVNAALDSAYAEPGVQDVLVSVPIKMLYGSERPYGDGQTNASIEFDESGSRKKTSKQKFPPLLATWSTFTDGTRKLTVRFQPMRGIDLTRQGTLIYFLKGEKVTQTFSNVKKLPSSQYETNWTVAANSIPWGDLYSNHVAYIQLPGRSDWFPIDFRNVVVPAIDLLQQIPADKRSFGIGTLLDPETIGAQQTIPYDLLNQRVFAPNMNSTRYAPIVGIHNSFRSPSLGAEITTSVGNGDTTVMLPPGAPFKMAYICFDPRNPDAETRFGVPSGGGWHEIGDPAETVFNTLENASPIFGYANGRPGLDLPSKEVPGPYAFGLSDVTVIRRLKPGEALVTAAGPTTTSEGFTASRGTGVAEGRNYHWFIFDQPHEVCAVEWVHPCMPNESNHVGLVCPAAEN